MRRGRTWRRRRLLGVLGLAVAVLVGTLVVVGARAAPACRGTAGFNWPNAGRVYLGGLDQLSTSAAAPDRPFAVARAHGLSQVRVFVGVDAAIKAWQQDPSAALAGMDRLLADAQRAGVQVIVSQYADEPMITALAGRPFASWAEAQRALTTPGSVAYQRFEAWLEALVPRYAAHPAVAAWEVVNEPGYMLGIDSGAVGVDQGLGFVEHFANLLHERGARVVSGGGRPVFDPMTLTDAQLARYVRPLDVLDDHLYPHYAAHAGGDEDAGAAVQRVQRWFGRAREVAGRPSLPGMLGEVGSLPDAWFETVLQEATASGLPTFAWAFDAYDPNDFTDATRPGVLATLTEAAAPDGNGGTRIARVGEARCEP